MTLSDGPNLPFRGTASTTRTAAGSPLMSFNHSATATSSQLFAVAKAQWTFMSGSQTANLRLSEWGGNEHGLHMFARTPYGTRVFRERVVRRQRFAWSRNNDRAVAYGEHLHLIGFVLHPQDGA